MSLMLLGIQSDALVELEELELEEPELEEPESVEISVPL